MGWTVSTHVEMGSILKLFVGKPEGTRHEWEENIKINFK
jgi:hypothetical protein